MNEIKNMTIYMDNSLEAHFDSNEAIILSPCGSEFVFKSFSSDNTIKSSTKYRTAYPLSIFSRKLNTILKERNRFCNDKPFISPILLESGEKSNNIWLETEDINEVTWQYDQIEMDYNLFYYTWKSKCKKAEFKLHFNEKIVRVKYPIKLPKCLNDEFEERCDLNLLNRSKNPNIKNLIKYTWNEEEFSSNHLPILWQDLHDQIKELIKLNKSEQQQQQSLPKSLSIKVKIPEVMPLSCSSTHLHKFDNIEILSEPKIIYLNETYFKLFYKNKSIEIICPTITEKEQRIQDYLISDSSTGRFYTCYSLNKRNGEIDQQKICIENIPSFRTTFKKTINYANILLKRISSIKSISNYSTCYIKNKLGEIDINNSASNDSTATINNTSYGSSETKSDIKNQWVINQVGHFKLMKNNSIVINFIDKVKLYFDSYSLEMYLINQLDKSICLLFYPDNSQHEMYLNEESTSFSSYISFLKQWIKWLVDNKALFKDDQANTTKPASDISFKTLQNHMSELKLFNNSYLIKQSFNNDESDEISADFQNKQLNISVSNLLKENTKFLKDISK